jgi:Domain of unknown function (DUF4326)
MQRIQRNRHRGWRAPPGAIYVGKTTQWANPHEIYNYGYKQAVVLFRQYVKAMSDIEREAWLAPLQLAAALMCWCPLDQPCHADVLIEYLTRSIT